MSKSRKKSVKKEPAKPKAEPEPKPVLIRARKQIGLTKPDVPNLTIIGPGETLEVSAAVADRLLEKGLVEKA